MKESKQRRQTEDENAALGPLSVCLLWRRPQSGAVQVFVRLEDKQTQRSSVSPGAGAGAGEP